jgi:hypothetical protein
VRIREGLPCGVHAPETGGEGKGAARVTGPKGDVGWAGCQAKEGGCGLIHKFGNLLNKRISFELRDRIRV